MNTRWILRDLQYNTGVFPRQAIKQAVANKEQITPALLEIIEDARHLPKVLYDDDYMAHVYALFLLAQFREQRALSPIVQFFSIPGEVTVECTCDVVTEDLHRILASVSHGDKDLIKSLAENEQANEYVRDAALDSLVTQMVNGQATREEVVDYYRALFRGCLDRQPSHTWDSLVSCSTALYPGELMGDIRQAFDDCLVDPGYIDLEFVTEALDRGEESALAELRRSKKRRLIEDVIADIEWWACFQPITSGVLPLEEKVGRNEPCPCGSGKKYKKCCGASTE